MKWWFRSLGFLGAAVLILLGLFVVSEHVRGRWALRHRLKELQARSERLSVASVEPKHPSPDRNGFVSLANLKGQFSLLSTHLDQVPPSLRFTAPGRAVVVARLKQWAGEGNTTNDWIGVTAELEGDQDLLDLVHAALAKPDYDSGFNYQKGFVDFQIGPLTCVKRAANLLGAATLSDLQGHRLADAHRNLLALILLSARQTPEPLVIAQLIRYACAAIAFNATWQALQTEEWTDAQLAALEAAWEQCDFTSDMGSAFEVERTLGLDFFDQLRQSGVKLTHAIAQRERANDIVAGSMNSFPTHGWILKWLHLPLWRFAWMDQDELRMLNRWQRMVQRERFARTHSWIALSSGTGTRDDSETMLEPSDPDEQLGWYDRLRFLFSSEPFSITDAAIRSTLEFQAQQQMAVTALAIRRYQLRHGNSPPDLHALVPEYLRALPKDWIDGKALRYRVRPGGGFVLYSVGQDGKDDGGDPTPTRREREYRQIWDGRDAVWPDPATDDEAAARR